MSAEIFLEKFADLVKEEHGARLVESLDVRGHGYAAVNGEGERAQRCQAHQKVFVQHLPVRDVPHRPPQHVVPDDEIYDEIQAEGEYPRRGALEYAAEIYDFIRNEHRREENERDDDAQQVFLFLFVQFCAVHNIFFSSF